MEIFDPKLYADAVEIEAFFNREIDSNGQNSNMIIPTQELIS